MVADDPGALESSAWPWTLAPVRQLAHGMEFGLTTVFVGDNGSGKSTIVEALAALSGLPASGGTSWEQRPSTDPDSGLSAALRLVRDVGAPRTGLFLRAESMHELPDYLIRSGSGRGARLQRMSHGEFFLECLSEPRWHTSGLWILDEPESALSFTNCLALLDLMRTRQKLGLQTFLSTHSPLLAAVPGAEIYEVGEWGLRQRAWHELEFFHSWRAFMASPEAYLRWMQ